MTWKETILGWHTKKRWPYAVLLIVWFIVVTNMMIMFVFGVAGAAIIESRWEEPGVECVWGSMGPATTCNNGICSTDDKMTLDIDTNGDWETDKTIDVNATEYYAATWNPYQEKYPKDCPPPGWIYDLIADEVNLNALLILGITIATWSLVVIRLIVWIRPQK